jgi:hypothetical protein
MSDNKDKKCGLCDHFQRDEGIFGVCLVKESEHAEDPTVFMSDSVCEYFTPKTTNKDELIQNMTFKRPGPPPHIAMFGGPSLLQMLLNGGGLPFVMKPAECNSCSEEDKKTEGWQNPVIRRKPGRKVVPWEEVKQRMLNRKQIGNTDL